MPVQSATDGQRRSLMSRWMGKPKRKKVRAPTQNGDDYVIQQIPMPAMQRNKEGEVETCDHTDFEELKRQRQEKLKNKLVKCIRAIRNSKAEDDSKLVDQLIQSY